MRCLLELREHQIESSNSIVSDSDRSEIGFRFVGGAFRGFILHREPLLRTYFPIPPCFWAPVKLAVQRQGGQGRVNTQQGGQRSAVNDRSGQPCLKERATKVSVIATAGNHAPKSGQRKCCKSQRRAPMVQNAGTQSAVNYKCGHRRASVMKSAGTQSAVNYRRGHPCSKTRAPQVL